MYDLKGKRLALCIVIILVILILLSNLGQTFKTDIFSYNNTIKHSYSYVNYFKQGTDYQDYINLSSNYIKTQLKNNDFSPLVGNSYTSTWQSYLPDFDGKSKLEVLSSYGKLVKTYQYSEDYYEDFRGKIRSGGHTGKMSLVNDLSSFTNKTSNIILFNGYSNKSSSEINNIDDELISHNISFVISPSDTNYLVSTSGLYDDSYIANGKGLSKLIVTQTVFEELKKYINKGMKLRVRSSSCVNTIEMKNVYGYLKGKNPNYPPLFIGAFYDGAYTLDQMDVNVIRNHSFSPSILNECLRAINLQRTLMPDRTIVFAFLSGYNQKKEGLDKLYDLNLKGDYLIIDSLGTGNKNMISYNKSAKYLASNIEIVLGKNKLDIITKNINKDNKNNIVFLNTITTEKNLSTINPYIVNSGKFILSLLSYECYNINFLTGNIQGFKFIKGFIIDHTLIISLLTFVLLLLIIFINPYGKRNWHHILFIINYY